jgi:hypothetical protein
MFHKFILVFLLFFAFSCKNEVHVIIDDQLKLKISSNDSSIKNYVIKDYKIHIKIDSSKKFDGFILKKNSKMQFFKGENLDIYITDSTSKYWIDPQWIRI